MLGGKRSRDGNESDLVNNDESSSKSIASENSPIPVVAQPQPNGLDIVRALGGQKPAIINILKHLKDKDLIAYAYAHPFHWHLASLVARNRLLARMSPESLVEYREITQKSYIDMLQESVDIGSKENGFSDNEILDRTYCINALTQGNIEPFLNLITYIETNTQNHATLTTPLIVDALGVAYTLGYDKFYLQLRNQYPRRWLDGAKEVILDAIAHNHLNIAALLILEHSGSSLIDPFNFRIMNDLYSEPQDKLRRIFNHMRRYLGLRTDPLPEVFPGERLITFAINLGCVQEAQALASAVDPDFHVRIRAIYKNAFIMACQYHNAALAQMLLPLIIDLKNHPEFYDGWVLEIFYKVVNDRSENLYPVLLTLADNTNMLIDCFRHGLRNRVIDGLRDGFRDRLIDGLVFTFRFNNFVDMLLKNYLNKIPPHIIEQEIYTAIESNNVFALEILLNYVSNHISAVGFREFIAYAALKGSNFIIKMTLEHFKPLNEHAQAIPLVYVPALEGSKKKRVRQSEVAEITKEADAFTQRRKLI